MENENESFAIRPAIRWLILFVASLGFAFDIYELLMMPVIMEFTLRDLLNIAKGTPAYSDWAGLFLFIPTSVGGVFGLLGGYLTDIFGRRRVLVWSILVYAFSALAAGFSTSIGMLLFFRCTTLIGVCVEFVAAVAWIAELFPGSRERETALGYTQAFSSLGGFMVAGAYWLAAHYAESLPAIHGAHQAWRYTLISGVIPALPLIFIRPFLPESPRWRQAKERGALKRPSFLELFKPAFLRTTVATTILFACSYAASFGAIQHVQRMVPGLTALKPLAREMREKAIAGVQMWQESGGLAGRFLLAYLVVRIISQRRLLRVFQLPGLVLVPLVFFLLFRVPDEAGLWFVRIGIFAAGLLTVGQFSFWGNYLPRVYPTYLRGTGESFAANVGGRIIGTFAAMLTTTLELHMPGESQAMRLAHAAALVAFLAYALGTAACFLLPQPESRDLPE